MYPKSFRPKWSFVKSIPGAVDGRDGRVRNVALVLAPPDQRTPEDKKIGLLLKILLSGCIFLRCTL
jgi:hypothetical protein